MAHGDIDQLVATAFDALFGFPLIQRIRVESGTCLDDLMLRIDARSVRNAGPLNRLLTHYHGPGDIRGNRVLLLEDAPAQYQLFGYVKNLRRVRRLPFRIEDPQRGTGLFMEDSLSLRVEDWEAKLLAEREVQEMPAVEVELRPRASFASAYERLVAVFALQPKPGLLSVEYHRGGSKLKTLRMDLTTRANAEGRDYVKVRTIEGPGRLVTVLTVVEFDPLDAVSEELFSVESLEHFTRISDEDGRI
jgi:hypothetical protein